MLQTVELSIPGVILITPGRFDDARGFFVELYNSKSLQSIDINDIFLQDNMSLSLRAGTIRGLHYQRPPHTQSKLVRVSSGRIFDVAVDLRPKSATYRKYVCAELSAENGRQVYIPSGFAHGFCTLEANTEVIYKVSSLYAPGAEGGILWSDPELNIDWPVCVHDAIVSEKDAKLPLLKDATPAV